MNYLFSSASQMLMIACLLLFENNFDKERLQDLVLEAESATLKGAIVSKERSGFTGRGYVDYIHKTAEYVEFDIQKSAAERAIVIFRYSNGSGSDRPLKLEVNGVVIKERLSFFATGSWTSWKNSQGITISLKSGSNRVRISSIGSSGPNIDHLALKSIVESEKKFSEAENAEMSGAVSKSEQPGFSGSGYADFQTATGSFIKLRIVSDHAGFINLQFRYANGSATDRPLRVEVNGAPLGTPLSFSPTGGWGKWAYTGCTVHVNRGTNVIRMISIGKNGGNIDHVKWENAPDPGEGLLEAETAEFSGAVVSKNQEGYTYNGFVDFVNNSADYIEWTVEITKPQQYLLAFRFSNGSKENRPLTLKVNGIEVTNKLNFFPTQSWNSWHTKRIHIYLAAGSNKIRLTANGSNGPNIDHMTWKKVSGNATNLFESRR